MIFPGHCKEVGAFTGKPCGERVYFLTRYLIRESPEATEVLEVEQVPESKGMMRRVSSLRTLAAGDEVMIYPQPVNLHDRTAILRLALASGHRCTIFHGLDEHTTFVCDPDSSGLLTIHLYDAVPPRRPHLSATVRELERDGLFGDLSVTFAHHVRDIREIGADVYPCRAAGFPRTLDSDPVKDGDRVAGCMTGGQIIRECGGKAVVLEDICPLEAIREEPFVARCCRSEREGVREFRGMFGGVVHWGASPRTIADTVKNVVEGWRSIAKNRGR